MIPYLFFATSANNEQLGPDVHAGDVLFPVVLAYPLVTALLDPVIHDLPARLRSFIRRSFSPSTSRLSFSPITHVETMSSDMVDCRQQTPGVDERRLVRLQAQVHRLTEENSRLAAAAVVYRREFDRQQRVSALQDDWLNARAYQLAEFQNRLRDVEAERAPRQRENDRLRNLVIDNGCVEFDTLKDELKEAQRVCASKQKCLDLLQGNQRRLIASLQVEEERRRVAQDLLDDLLQNKEKDRRKTRCTSCGGSFDHCHHGGDPSPGAVGTPPALALPSPAAPPPANPTANPPDLPTPSSRPDNGTSVIVPTGLATPITEGAGQHQPDQPRLTLVQARVPPSPTIGGPSILGAGVPLPRPVPLLPFQPVIAGPAQPSPPTEG